MLQSQLRPVEGKEVADYFCVNLQVVTLAVYSYFMTAVIARQWLDPETDPATNPKHRSKIDLYFPFFLTLQVSMAVYSKS